MMPAVTGYPTGRLKILHAISLAILLCWSFVLLGLLFWAISKEERHVLKYAQLEAKANFNKDIALRNWAAKRGGVYVQVSEGTPPNPHLEHIAERDIVTSSGKKLTLMNPAYMLRQIMNEFSELYGIKGRITSLKPSNPINTPDTWEINALKQFDRGVTEISEFSSIAGKPYLRYMQAFYTTEVCLKCHRHQGYEVGDVRGGVGVSVPLKPYIKIKENTVRVLMYSYGILWLTGLFGIIFVNYFAKHQILKQSGQEFDLAVEKERLELVLEGTGLGLWDWNPQTDSVVFDDRWAKILGYELSEIEPSLDSWKLRVHPDDLSSCFRDIQAHIKGTTEAYSNIHRMMHKDGTWRYILDRGKIVERDRQSRPVRFTGTHTDISRLKETENALVKKTEELRRQSVDLERLNRILSQQAMHDGLTHVYNRRAFDRRFQQEWQRWRRDRAEFSILLFDIDFFKRYNDCYGHLSGDSCLKTIAGELDTTAAGVNGFTARYGGEEFVIILPDIKIDQAMGVAEKARQAVEKLALPHCSSGCADVVTLSVGVAASVQTTDSDGHNALVALADQALYSAKNNGRNQAACLT